MIVNERQPLNRAILDYPHKLDPAKWFFWYWNGVRWPSGSRETSILTNIRSGTRRYSWVPMDLLRDAILYDTREAGLVDWPLYGGQYGHRLHDDQEMGFRLGQKADVIRLVGYPESGYVERK